jgi:hypothetical protein
MIYQKAVEVLEKELKQMEESYRRDSANLREAINDLQTTLKSEKPKKSNGKTAHPVRAGKWKGMTIADAIQAYLSMCDGPAPFPALVEGLKKSGVYLGDDPERCERNIRSTLGNTKNRFRYNKKKELVGLVQHPSA